jgi:hypothetical protein
VTPLSPRMREALAAADPHGLTLGRAAWFRSTAIGGWSLDGPNWSRATVDAVVRRGFLAEDRPSHLTLTPLGRAALAEPARPVPERGR